MTEAKTPEREEIEGWRASQALMLALLASDRETVTIEELARILRRRAFGFVLLLAALVNCVPLPPFISSLMGVPVFLIGAQLLMGRRRPWLPLFVRRRAFSRADMLRAMHRIGPVLRFVERVAKPRLPGVVGVMAPRTIGFVVVILSIYIMLPLVFTNIPPALATVFLALALIEEDGAMMLLGVPVALLALTVSTVLAAGTITVVLLAISRFFGF